MLHTSLCDLLDIDTPILQAGMAANLGSPTTPALEAAASNAGGLGATGFTTDAADIVRAWSNETSQIISNLQGCIR